MYPIKEIIKSTRHSYIIGKSGEYILCNWLSRSEFEVAIVDHTGLDIVAFNPKTEQRFGITVKSRTRVISKEADSVNIFSYRGHKNDRKRLLDACKAFECEPWIAVYVETLNSADLYLTSLDNYDNKYGGKSGRVIDRWRMSSKYKALYQADKAVKHITANFNQDGWDW